MAPSLTAVSGLLRQVIQHHLDNSSYDNALFFAERFVAQDPRSSEATHLYALCHLRLGDYRSAYDVGKPMGYRGTNLGCAWVFAQACLSLERFKDGITALEKSRILWSSKGSLGKNGALLRAGGCPDAAAVLCLLGKLYRGYDDKKKAAGAFEEALKLNPFQWDAFTALCDMGVNVRVPNIFRSSDLLARSFDPEAVATARTPASLANSNTLEMAPKKSSLRSLASDLGSDPFNVGFSLSEATSPLADVFSESADGDLMTKIQSARLRLGTSSSNLSLFDATETPPGPSADVSRMVGGHDPPQAPPRRARQAQVIDAGLEAPPRMNYRLGTKRSTRSEDRDMQQAVEPIMDGPVAAVGITRAAALSTADRKRTLSGHPVSRAANIDDTGTRRSARLTTFKPSSRANSGAATIGASAGRELKKARPPISRIVRPGSSGANVGRVVSGNRKPIDDHADVDHGEASRVREPAASIQTATQPPIPPKQADEAVKIEEAVRWIMDVLKKLGNGYYFLSRFQCQEALQALSSLPPAHQGTPWVLVQMGRAHYEQASYAEAEKFFRRMRVQAPSRLQDMEVYSTILWHLKRETDLSFLAHELVDSAWHSPQAWCALGNAWSLAKDPEQALKCFKRATQLDPKFAYAFTLQGHEHVTNEEYEQALTAYRQAISADKRHYNAYYGIGRVQERLGDYDKALTHFQAAQSINPNNAVLVSWIGTVLERQKQIIPALRAYTKAVELAPRAALTRYKKAHALLAIGQIEDAEKELVILKDLAPNEGHVHFLLGTLYRSMNERQLAVRHFTIALALDPKVKCRDDAVIELVD
ncbi:20S cyclosome subunit (BimA/Nuc2/Cdc27), putative [Cordyceps militaris CM01]|uniref:20S cyclosome subunit (BimA/Nuc2/Cdc27), putative n=1 Tax=Cordyceps militaris (strain CM01) TaxID=983644 RepID=G3JQ18_CORMM|nr:20S cyclosome subunit (BimA/Nuc2/Cdc27), putative [Cordyceps militaris CM01]EGX89269.1 20S cyclosome subunit (BimA/Nuc2/Cdc27), putative [Cordyceps militaris CM01]